MYIFDVCDTLYLSNTTFDFVRFVLEQKGEKVKIFRYDLYTKKYSPLFILFFAMQKFTKKDTCKSVTLKLLRGLKKKELTLYAESFVEKNLSAKIIHQTHELLEKAIQNNDNVYLLSASISPVVAAISKHLGVPYKSSELAFSDEIFTGKIKNDLTGKKQNVLSEILIDKEELIVISDNFTDKSLMRLANKRYAVVYNKEAKLFWEDVSPIFIDLSK